MKDSKYDEQLAEFYSKMDEYDFITPKSSFNDDICFNYNYRSVGFYEQTHDLLFINSNVLNGENLFGKLCDKYYFYDIDRVGGRGLFKCLHPIVCLFADKNNGNHSLKFDFDISLRVYLTVIGGWTGDKPNPGDIVLKQDNPFAFARDYIRGYLKKINDVIELGKDSEYYDLVCRLTKFYEGNKTLEIDEETLLGLRDVFNICFKNIVNLRKNKDLYGFINVKEFKNCFNIDKLYLLIAKSILDQQYSSLDKDHKISDSYYQLLFYVNNLLKDDFYEKYNPSIKVYNEKTNIVEKYSVMDLLKEVKSLIKYCEERNIFIVSIEDLKRIKLDSVDDMDDLFKLLSEEDQAALKMSWTFLRPGEVEQGNHQIDNNDGTDFDDGKNDDKKIKPSNSLYHKYVLDKTNYKCKIVGKEKFAGYIGYIYDNGLVVFEKIYKNNMKDYSTDSNATYVMKFISFAKFTKLDKQEIIEYIKSTDNPEVKRVYHRKNWKERIQSIINGLEYNDEISQLIDAFIETQQDYKFD